MKKKVETNVKHLGTKIKNEGKGETKEKHRSMIGCMYQNWSAITIKET